MAKKLTQECMRIVENTEKIPLEIQERCVYEECNGEKKYLDGYIPFIGEKYGQGLKVMFYGMAQNLSDVNSEYRKEYDRNPQGARNRLGLKEEGTLNMDMDSIASGVMPALAGVFLYLKEGLWEEDLAKVLQRTSATNYYKLSLWNENRKDLHPGMLKSPEKEEYAEFMLEQYVSKEIEVLKPDYIFAFLNCPYQSISRYVMANKLSVEVIPLKETAWITSVGKEMLPDEWLRENRLEDDAEKLLECYCKYIRTKTDYLRYEVKTDAVKAYVRHYCNMLKT